MSYVLYDIKETLYFLSSEVTCYLYGMHYLDSVVLIFRCHVMVRGIGFWVSDSL